MKKLLLIFLLCPLFVARAHAEALPEEAVGILDVAAVEEAVPEALRPVSGRLGPGGQYDGESALARLWAKLCESLRQAVRDKSSAALRLLGLSLLCALAAAVCPDKREAEWIQTAACAAAAVVLLRGLDSLVPQAAAALEQLSDYSRAAMPAVFTASAVSGAAVSASARYGAVCLALDVLMSVSKRLTIPLIYAYIALCISASLADNPILRAFSGLLRRAAILLMTGLTIAFTAYIGVTGIVTGGADAAAVKAAKTVISTALPVVGGILSDAASSVLSAASVIKSSAGALSLVAVCALCIGPFASLGVQLVLFRMAAAAAALLPGERLSGLLNQMGSAMGMLLGLVGSFGFMLFFSFLAAIRAVTV